MKKFSDKNASVTYCSSYFKNFLERCVKIDSCIISPVLEGHNLYKSKRWWRDNTI